MADNSVQIQEVQVIGESVQQPTAQEGGPTLNREQSEESLEALLQRAIDESVRSQRNLSKVIAQLKERKSLGRPCQRHGRWGGRHHKPTTSSSSSNSSESETEGVVVRHQHNHGHGDHRGHCHRRRHHGGRDRSRSRGHSRGRSRGHSRGHSRGRSRGHSKTRGFHGHAHKHFPVSIVV